MQLLQFDPWAFLLSVIFFLTTCHTSQPVSMNMPKTSIRLVEPKPESRPDYSELKTKLTLILLGNDGLYTYEKNKITAGKFIAMTELNTLLQKTKKKYASRKFVVIIKSAPGNSYSQTVNVLDEMVTSKIERYSIEELSSEEKEKLNVQ
jgi:biopolymer transport protein ExbD